MKATKASPNNHSTTEDDEHPSGRDDEAQDVGRGTLDLLITTLSRGSA